METFDDTSDRTDSGRYESLLEDLRDTAFQMEAEALRGHVLMAFAERARGTMDEKLFRTLLFDAMAATAPQLAERNLDASILREFGIRCHEYDSHLKNCGRWPADPPIDVMWFEKVGK